MPNTPQLPQDEFRKRRNDLRGRFTAVDREWIDDALALLGHRLGDGSMRDEAHAWEIFDAVFQQAKQQQPKEGTCRLPSEECFFSKCPDHGDRTLLAELADPERLVSEMATEIGGVFRTGETLTPDRMREVAEAALRAIRRMPPRRPTDAEVLGQIAEAEAAWERSKHLLRADISPEFGKGYVNGYSAALQHERSAQPLPGMMRERRTQAILAVAKELEKIGKDGIVQSIEATSQKSIIAEIPSTLGIAARLSSAYEGAIGSSGSLLSPECLDAPIALPPNGPELDYPPFLSADQDDDSRECPRCHKPYTSACPDPCIGMIPGANEACCGHGGVGGEEGKPYIVFPSDNPMTGKDRILVEFPIGCPAEIVKSVGLAISETLGRAGEKEPRAFMGVRMEDA